MTKRKPNGLGPGPGRPKGAPNKITSNIRDMLEAAIDEVGGIAYFTKLAESDPKAFCSLLARIIPTSATITTNVLPALEVIFASPSSSINKLSDNNKIDNNNEDIDTDAL